MEKQKIAVKKYYEDKNYEALKIFEENLSEERSVANLMNLAYYYVDMYSNYEKAEKYLEEAIEKVEGDELPYALLGEVYLELQKDDKAIEMLNKSYYIKKTNIVQYNIFIAYFNKQEYEKAKEWIEKNMQEDELRNMKYCLTLFKLGKKEELAKELKKCEEELDVDDHYYWIAELYASIGMIEDAARCYEKEFAENVVYASVEFIENYLYVLLRNNEEEKYKEIIKKEIKRRKEEIKETKESDDETWTKQDRDEYIDEIEEQIIRLNEICSEEGIKKMKNEYQIKLEEKLEARQYVLTRCYFYGCEHCGNTLNKI